MMVIPQPMSINVLEMQQHRYMVNTEKNRQESDIKTGKQVMKEWHF